MLRTSLFVANQVDILINYWLVYSIKYSKLSRVWRYLISSANRFILNIFDTFAISFVYMLTIVVLIWILEGHHKSLSWKQK